MACLAQLERRMQTLNRVTEKIISDVLQDQHQQKVCVFVSSLHLLPFLDPHEEQLVVGIDQSIFNNM